VCSNLLLRELALASAQDWSPAPPSAARAATGLLEHLSDAALPPSDELAAVRMVGAEALEAALQEKGEWVRVSTRFFLLPASFVSLSDFRLPLSD
jgi:hypothetical protein